MADEKLPKLREAVAGLAQISDKEKSGFISLVSRYLSGDEEHIEWAKIHTLTDEVVVPYDTLESPPEDLEATKALQQASRAEAQQRPGNHHGIHRTKVGHRSAKRVHVPRPDCDPDRVPQQEVRQQCAAASDELLQHP